MTPLQRDGCVQFTLYNFHVYNFHVYNLHVYNLHCTIYIVQFTRFFYLVHVLLESCKHGLLTAAAARGHVWGRQGAFNGGKECGCSRVRNKTPDGRIKSISRHRRHEAITTHAADVQKHGDKH